MATWKQENIMLTKVGERALASAEAGEGKITITKVIGSEFNPVDMYNITSTSSISTNLSFNIVDRKLIGSVNGTSIAIQATNKEVTSKFRLNTIVVFATQSSIYSGEFPYLIAKTLNADEVDIPTITPITLNFALTLLNTRGGLLNITVSNTGFVTIPTYLVDMQDYQNNVVAFGLTTGSEVTQLLNSQFLNYHPITLKDGVSVKVKLGYNLKYNSTLNVAGTGDKKILDVTGNTIPDDTFTQGSMLNLMYDTTRNAWIVTGGEVLTASNGVQKVGKDMQLVDMGVLTKHIKDLNVTTSKLADKSVTYNKLDDNLKTKLDPDYVQKAGDTMNGDLKFIQGHSSIKFQVGNQDTHMIRASGDNGENLELGTPTTTSRSNLCCYNRPGWYGKDKTDTFKPFLFDDDMVITSGTINNGQTLPIPEGFREDDCHWILTVAESHLNMGEGQRQNVINTSGLSNLGVNVICKREGLKVTVGTQYYQHTPSTDYYRGFSWFPGKANYVCICRRHFQ